MQIGEKLSRKENYAREPNRAAKDIRYLVIHFTGNDGDTAGANAAYFAREAVGVSAHYFVDASEVWRSVPEACTAWHCGTKGAYFHPVCRNRNSIGIELCSRKDSAGRYLFAPVTVMRAAALTRLLMARYNIPAERVLRHYDVTHKNCPEPFVRDAAAWQAFRDRLKEDEKMTIYKTWAEVPDWARDTVAKLTQKGLLQGEEGYLNLEHNMLRGLVINDRAGLYDDK